MCVGAFGKVRLCKIIKGGGFQGGSKTNRSPSMKTEAKSNAGESGEDDTQICAIKILSKNAIIKAKQVDHVYNEMALQQKLNHPFIVNMRGLQ